MDEPNTVPVEAPPKAEGKGLLGRPRMRIAVYIRYLPPGVNAGASGAGYLTVATYPFKDAYQALAIVKTGKHISIPDGGTALVAPTYKKSIHLAYPNVSYQVEVYDPSPARVLELVRSGRIRPV